MTKESKKILKRFGRYLLLDHLVDGGMAKICRARYLGEQADKVVAIKMIQSQYSSDANFVKMFEDEIKVTFSLIHPNIAQTYNSGKIDGLLFVAMEYVDGKNLKQYLDRLKERNYVFPVEISTYIITQVCQALTYAHGFTNKLTGTHLNIIHRDISPHNIMLTYDGTVKVIDFGIAKAETNSDSTKVGTIKGKLSYLAPEYLDGKTLDHRYDQFGVGIVLWELLCSRKLFKANNELAVLKLIQACKVPPPSSINPNVPKELDEITMKALSKDREQRYENMEQFARALTRVLYEQYKEFNPSDLSYFAKELFSEEIEEDRKQLVEFGKIDVKEFIKDLKTDKSGSFKTSSGKLIEQSFGILNKPNGAKLELSKNIALPAEVKSIASGTNQEQPNSNVLKLEPTKKSVKSPEWGSRTHQFSKSKIQDSDDGTSWKEVISKTVGSITLLVLVSYLFKDPILETYRKFTENKNQIIQDQRTPANQNPEKKKGTIVISGINSYQEIFLNKEKIVVPAIGIVEVNLNTEYELLVKQDGYKTFRVQFLVDETDENMAIKIPKLEKVAEGELISGKNFGSENYLLLYVDEEVIEYSLPLDKVVRLPVGQYRGLIKDKNFDTEREVVISIELNKRTTLK